MQNQVLIVDDMATNRLILREMLDDEYDIIEAENGYGAIEIVTRRRDEIAVILLDLVMPKVDGYNVLKVLHKTGYMKKIPVIIITGEDSIKTRRQCFEYKIADFVQKPFDESVIKKRIQNVIELYMYRNSIADNGVVRENTQQRQIFLLQQEIKHLGSMNESLLELIGCVGCGRSTRELGHVRRIREYTRILATQFAKSYPEYEITTDEIEMAVSASVIYDIGKIQIPDRLLLKKTRYTKEEEEMIRSHTIRGGEIIHEIKGIWKDTYRRMCYEICRHHHERFDGTGYPDGLQGDEISVFAQIVGLADTYDTLVYGNVRQEGMPPKDAYHKIISGECGSFSPKLLECFREVEETMERHQKEA